MVHKIQVLVSEETNNFVVVGEDLVVVEAVEVVTTILAVKLAIIQTTTLRIATTDSILHLDQRSLLRILMLIHISLLDLINISNNSVWPQASTIAPQANITGIYGTPLLTISWT